MIQEQSETKPESCVTLSQKNTKENLEILKNLNNNNKKERNKQQNVSKKQKIQKKQNNSTVTSHKTHTHNIFNPVNSVSVLQYDQIHSNNAKSRNHKIVPCNQTFQTLNTCNTRSQTIQHKIQHKSQQLEKLF